MIPKLKTQSQRLKMMKPMLKMKTKSSTPNLTTMKPQPDVNMALLDTEESSEVLDTVVSESADTEPESVDMEPESEDTDTEESVPDTVPVSEE